MTPAKLKRGQVTLVAFIYLIVMGACYTMRARSLYKHCKKKSETGYLQGGYNG